MSTINISEGEISSLPHSYYIQIAHNYNVKLKKPPKHFFVLCVMLPPVKWVHFLKKKKQPKNSMTDRDRNRDRDREKERETFINVLELGVQVRVKSMKDLTRH